MAIYFFVMFGLYYSFVVLMIYGWSKQPQITSPLQKHPYASVVIAVRNESGNIAKLITSLSEQTMPKESFEIIIVDDNSTDATVAEIEQYSHNLSLPIKILTSSLDEKHLNAPKKAAIIKGIEAAQGEIVVMTDGDCWFGREWLSTMLDSFKNNKTMFAAGPVALAGGNKIFAVLQRIEFASLTGSGAAMINLGYPLMCNGANLAFRKDAFNKVSGYTGNENIASGDDVFLMQKIHMAYPQSVTFVKHPEAIVFTKTQPSLTAFYLQRKRWASKWRNYVLPLSWALPVFLFIHYLFFLLALMWLLVDFQQFHWLAVVLAVKLALDYVLLKMVMNFCKLRLSVPSFLMSELLYPLYALIIGTSVHFGRYTWKGRNFKM